MIPLAMCSDGIYWRSRLESVVTEKPGMSPRTILVYPFNNNPTTQQLHDCAVQVTAWAKGYDCWYVREGDWNALQNAATQLCTSEVETANEAEPILIDLKGLPAWDYWHIKR